MLVFPRGAYFGDHLQGHRDLGLCFGEGSDLTGSLTG